jgi:hypothetical protein
MQKDIKNSLSQRIGFEKGYFLARIEASKN